MKEKGETMTVAEYLGKLKTIIGPEVFDKLRSVAKAGHLAFGKTFSAWGPPTARDKG